MNTQKVLTQGLMAACAALALSGCLQNSGIIGAKSVATSLDQSETPAPAASPSPVMTQSPTPSPVPSPTMAPSPSPTVKPSPSPVPSPSPKPSPSPTVKPSPSPTPAPSPTVSPTPTAPASPNPVPSVSVPVIEGLAPPTTITPCKLQVWKRNVPNSGFNNVDVVLYVPCDYNVDPNKRYPLVVSNHGRGGSTLDTATHSTIGGKTFEGFIKQFNNANLLATYGAIVVAPDLHAVGDGGDFFPGPGITNMEARLVIDSIKFLKVDPKKVVVTGLSYGGSLTEDMMINYLPLLAGAAPVAMQPPNKGNMTKDNTCPFVTFPIWAAGNDGDGVFNYYEWIRPDAAGFKTTLKGCPGYIEGAYLQFTTFSSTVHGGWDEFYSMPAAQNWLMNQTQK